MGEKDEKADHPLEWPIVWFRDQSFWREVATRTIAGAFALILVGAPALLVLIFSGAADPNTWWALLAAAIMFVGAIVLWAIAFGIRRILSKKTLTKIARPSAEEAVSTVSGLAVLSVASGIAVAIAMIFVQ